MLGRAPGGTIWRADLKPNFEITPNGTISRWLLDVYLVYRLSKLSRSSVQKRYGMQRLDTFRFQFQPKIISESNRDRVSKWRKKKRKQGKEGKRKDSLKPR